jgi:serine-type D-Ala-D-Ala carboxypeptidase
MTKEILKNLRKGITENVYQDAELLVSKSGKTVFHEFAGQPNNQKGNFFDLASLTKPLCTAMLCMLAYEQGKLNLDALLTDFYPQTTLTKTTIRELLNHTSGLIDWFPFYEKWITNTKESSTEIKRLILQDIHTNPGLFKESGKTTYSDLGYMILGDLLEKIYKQNLDIAFNEFIATPLQLENQIFFRSLNKNNNQNISLFIPSEICELRGKTMQAEVMDRNTYVMGGVSGHAGLFGNALAIHRLLEELHIARQGNSKLIKQKTFELFCKPDLNRDAKKASFTLGFDTKTEGISQSGNLLSTNTIGHLGYAGANFWWDLECDLWIIFLTNRCMPSRENKKISKFRPALHDLIVNDLGDS